MFPVPFAILLFLASHSLAATTSVDYCGALEDVYSICAESTPGFSTLPATDLASCACGTALGTISWGPTLFDELVAGCVSMEATIDPGAASTIAEIEGFCASYAPTPAATSAATTANSALERRRS